MARTIAKDHDEKRAAILRQAALFFAEKGYDAASMREVGAACGVSKALIYHYYRSKEALLFDILHRHLQDLLEAVEAVPQSTTPEAHMDALIAGILAAYRDADAEHKLQFNAIDRLPNVEKRQLAAIQRRLVEIMAEAVTALAPAKFSAQPELIRPTVMAVFGMLNWFYTWHRSGAGINREDYGKLVSGMVLGGVDGVLGE